VVEEAWVSFEAVVATTHTVSKYGGVALTDAALTKMADALNAGSIPMLAEHDWTQPMRAKEVVAEVVTLDDGERAVRIRGRVIEADWRGAGDLRGFSFSGFEELGRAEGPNPEAPSIFLAGDAAWFEDEVIGTACSMMCSLAPLDGSRLYQFAAADEARAVLELGYSLVLALGPGLATSAIWDGLKYLLLHRRQTPTGDTDTTRIELRTILPNGEVIAVVHTTDPTTAAQALEAYSVAVREAVTAATGPRHVIVWKPSDDGGSWELPK
jgi:hypothetical protein